MTIRRSLALLVPAALVLAACSSDDSPTAVDTTPRPVTVRFAARVGDAAFACGQNYANLGATRSTVSATEFMAFVSDVKLLTADGAEVPLALTADGKWQAENFALLDFAAGGPGTACANASPETNAEVKGTAPAGTYTGLRYTLGLPFARNHGDATTAAGPLSATIMWWGWNAGYKALRLDLKSTGVPNGWYIHLGSTGCTPSTSASTVPTSCAEMNRRTYTLTGFDPSRNVVVADVAALLASSNLDANQGGPAGCMSGTTDGDCSAIFAAFGLPFNGGGVPATQAFFRVGSN